jgi:hypothetical protein
MENIRHDSTAAARVVQADALSERGFSGKRDSWPAWSARATALWSAAYGLLGIWWMSHPADFPFGAGPASGPASSFWAGIRATSGAPIVAVLGFAGAAVALLMMTPRSRGAARSVLLGFAVVVSATLLVLVPDARALAVTAYAPIFLAGAPFDWPPISFWEAIPSDVPNQFVCIVGGFLWSATAVGFARVTRGACIACGRAAVDPSWTSPAAAARWGRWGVGIAVIAPLAYATTRLAWVLGIPLGISEALLHEVHSTDMWGAAAGLASVAISGAILTVGLVRPWGETFPRWLPALRGKRVPPALAIVPATFVSVLVFAAGLGLVRDVLRDGLPGEDWLASAPGLLWPFWGLGLGAATLAYHYRRRGRCTRCGRG